MHNFIQLAEGLGKYYKLEVWGIYYTYYMDKQKKKCMHYLD